MRPYNDDTYYDRPAVKPSHWDWTVSGYIWLAGLGGAAQLIAAIAQGTDRERFRGAIRNARIISTVGSAIGAGLLIIDLKTPQRWYNMLRILRPTSPMSFGSYILSGFGGLSALTLLGEVMDDRGKLGRAAGKVADAAQFGAAVTGAGAATYTASLLSATSSPGWAAAPRHLGALFGTAAMASAAAALALGERIGGRDANARKFEKLAGLSVIAHLGAQALMPGRRREAGLPAPSPGSREARLKGGGLVLAAALPLAAYAAGRRAGRHGPTISAVGSAGLLAGTFMLRHAALQQGIESTKQPRGYFRWAQPRQP